MIGECEPDTNSVDATAEPDWDESSDESSDDSSDNLSELDYSDMPELVDVPFPIENSSRPESAAEVPWTLRADRLIPRWDLSYAQYLPIGHTHNDIDQIFNHRCSQIPNSHQRVPPFPSLRTDNAPSEFKSYLRAML